jgi:molybdopterin/thiamine biosynthesis adenylyltransferase
MDDTQLLRYSRHILLDEIGIEGQQRLLRSRALVIGAGASASPVALYLAAPGVGHLTVVDPDHVDLTNLQRQIAHNLAGWVMPRPSRHVTRSRPSTPTCKCMRACSAPTRSRSMCWCARPTWCSMHRQFQTRHAINAACVQARVPLVAGAAIRFDGQISVYDTRDASCPCYACVFRPMPRSKTCRVRRWACSRRWWASSARCRRPKP